MAQVSVEVPKDYKGVKSPIAPPKAKVTNSTPNLSFLDHIFDLVRGTGDYDERTLRNVRDRFIRKLEGK